MRKLLVVAALLAACASAPTPSVAPTPKWADGLPPIPDTISSILGPVQVVVGDSLRNERGVMLLGGFMPQTRTIYLDRSLKNPIVVWTVLRHEQCHVIMWDSGNRNFFDSEAGQKIADALCDAFATARVQEMLQEAKK